MLSLAHAKPDVDQGSIEFLHGTCRHRERDFDIALTVFLHFTDAGKETLAVLSPHFYMAHADVRKEAALGSLSPEGRYERAGVRDVATLPLLTDSDMFTTPYTKSD